MPFRTMKFPFLWTCPCELHFQISNPTLKTVFGGGCTGCCGGGIYVDGRVSAAPYGGGADTPPMTGG
eukprot:m.98208 g.98208  ORF g.98208 m.98208 type:complete len:67 (-) comp27042_c1_seq3:360-560(-)